MTVTPDGYIDVATYGRNSESYHQTTSQAIQADAFQQFAEDGFKRLFGKPARIVEDYKDHGKSASKKKSKRADFDRMMNDVTNGKHKVILFLNTSRVSRLHPADTIDLHNTFRKANAHLVCIEDNKVISIEEFGDLITLAVKANSDHEYARSVAANTLRGSIRSLKTKGTTRVAHIPYGMCKLVIDEAGEERVYPRTNNFKVPKSWRGYLVPGNTTEQEVVRWLFNTYLEDDISLLHLARLLNHHANPTWRLGPTGKGWDDSQIKVMLRNRHYRSQEFIGTNPQGEHFRTVDGQAIPTKQATEIKPVIVDTAYPPVVPIDTFDKVQAKLERNKGRKPRCHNTDGYALSGCLVCGHCGYSMMSAGNGRYRCQSSERDCKQWGVREDEILPFLVQRIDKELLKRLQDKPEVLPLPQQEQTRQQLKTIEDKMRIISAQLANPITTVEACRSLSESIAKLGEEKERLQSQLRDDDSHYRLQLAIDDWEEHVKPYLIALKTGNEGEGNEAVKTLGLQDECDRLFNFTDAKPSRLRGLLHSLGVKVTLFFTDKPRSKLSKGQRQHYQLERGSVTITVQGITTALKNPESSKNNLRPFSSQSEQGEIPSFGAIPGCVNRCRCCSRC